MAESMKGLKRTCRCAEVTKADIGKKVTLMGWVQKSRNKGGIIFVDLRDRSGIMQIIFENGPISEEGFEKAAKLRSEFVIAVEGEVMARSGAVNENLELVKTLLGGWLTAVPAENRLAAGGSEQCSTVGSDFHFPLTSQ